MLSLPSLLAALALLAFISVDADESYTCAQTNNNNVTSNGADMMCQPHPASDPCQRVCNKFAYFIPNSEQGEGLVFCVTNAYVCAGGCDSETNFKLSAGNARELPKVSMDCCQTATTENALVCAKCTKNSNDDVYYKDFILQEVTCSCSQCDSAIKSDKEEKLEDLFGNNPSLTEVVGYSHDYQGGSP